MTKRFLLVGLLFLAACGQEQQDPSPDALRSELSSPTDVTLHWRPTAGAAGQVVEYSNTRDGDYTVLEFSPPEQTSYKHPDLIPETEFYYRVRPFNGPASATVDIALPPGEEVPETDGHEWAEPVKGGGGQQPVSSADAAPTAFKGVVKHANGIHFTWEDKASDEEGYLIEVKPAGAAHYRVAAQLDPDVTSFGLITLPEEKTATYRVRPFRFGSPSNLTNQKTGKV